ncbi:ECF transporter S component [Clostridium polyendosporum]|nr:ECF transporter S component [Clostridium polyendosporum]
MTQIVERNSFPKGEYMFNLRLGDMLRATMFGTLDAVINDILHMPLHMPGHTSIWWMGILLVGKGLIRKFGSGIIMGIVSGILAVILGLGKEGIFVFLKYFIPGLLLDFLAPLYSYRLESPIIGAICGALASLSKLAVSTVIGIIVNIPVLFLTLGLGYVALSHVLYGSIGGVLAAVIIKRLKPRLSNWD